MYLLTFHPLLQTFLCCYSSIDFDGLHRIQLVLGVATRESVEYVLINC